MEQPTPVEVSRAGDVERFVATDHLVWFEEPSDDPAESLAAGVPADQRFAADIPGESDEPGATTHAGVYGVRPMEVAVPSGPTGAQLVPMAGLTWVGVHPDHRRRGVLTAMLRHHVEQTHREGVALSVLHASEPKIYGRHGYGLASSEHQVTLGRGAEFTAPGLADQVAPIRTRLCRLADPGVTERLRAVDRASAEEPGDAVFAPEYYDAVARERPMDVRDKETQRALFAVVDGEDVGCAVFRREHKWEAGMPQGTLGVGGLTGSVPARLALLRRLVDYDLMASTRLSRVGTDDPLWSWIGPRAAKVETYDSLWVRPVDLPAALAARGYAADCDVVIEVADSLAPWNAGRWRWRVSGGTGALTRSEDPAEVEVTVADLGGAYLGGGNLLARHRAGLITEHRAGAAEQLWRAFRTDLAPTCTPGF